MVGVVGAHDVRKGKDGGENGDEDGEGREKISGKSSEIEAESW